MNKIEKLTINGQTYAVADQRISDGPMGETVWTSERLISGLLPQVKLEGSPVQGSFLPGTPLNLQAQFSYSQGGSGTPTPENVRPITGARSLTVEQGGQTLVVDLGQEVFGGSYDWKTGILTITWKAVTIGSLNWEKWTSTSTTKHVFSARDLQEVAQNSTNGTVAPGTATSYQIQSVDNVLKDQYDACYAIGLNNRAVVVLTDSRCDSADRLLELAGDQRIVYCLKNPEQIQLTPQSLMAEGECRVTGENARITLEGYPGDLLAQLLQRVQALETKSMQEV